MSWVFLDPEAGDVVELYDTVDVVHPKTKAVVKALAHKPDGGGCIYLGPNGCTIHDRAPSLCRAFDCRVYYRTMKAAPRAVRKRELRDQYSAKNLFEAGRDLERKYPADESDGLL
jgi:Fe-S-cluster containining protein